MLHIGDEPTKKDTGELEEILPSWLKDARQQGREDSGGDATLKSETKPRVQKSEAPDLLAGLMSQADSDDDEVPDWLASINPVAEKTPPKPTSAKDDFFAQFEQSEAQPPKPPVSEPAQQPAAKPKNELSDWFSQQASSEPEPAFNISSEPVADDNSWMNNLGSFDDVKQEEPAEKEPEDLSWLHNLESSSKQADDFSAPQKDAGFDFAPSSSGDDLSWLNSLGGTSAPSFEQPASSQPASSNDDLSWLNNLGGTPAPEFEQPAPSQPASSNDDLSWLNNLGETPVPSFEQPAPSQPASSQDDLSWLNNLGATSAPSFEESAPSQPASSQDDLSWLNNLGATSAPSFEESAPSQPASSQDDLSWLNNLGATSASSFEESAPSQPASSQDDTNWLNALGGTPAPAFEEPVSSQPASSQDDMSWLDNLGGTPAPAQVFEEPASAQPSSSQDDMSWLNALGSTPAPVFEQPAPALSADQQAPAPSEPSAPKPFSTAPLNELLKDKEIRDANPDWLTSAIEEPSMPGAGDLSMDWLSNQGKSTDSKQFDKPLASSPPSPVSAQSGLDLPSSDSSTPSAQDVDSLFDLEMPDWLSNESAGTAETSQTGVVASEQDSLAPVELPSWVQAMRPVGSSIDGAIPSSVDQVTEREGPLAGFSNVIPSAPIGSSIRPKAFSLKLQVTEEQQTGASLFEQILAGETVAQPAKPTTAFVSSQRMLRWVLSAVFILVLTLVLGLGLKTMPIVPSNQLSDLVATVPDSAPVLIVIDYEPSLAGELEATSGPLLDQLALSRRSTFTFISMSPNGSALVDRLISNTKITTPDGVKYQPEMQYFNKGFLPGGSAGVLGFIENPVDEFSNFQAVILMTDNAESARVWVEQLEIAKGSHPEIANKPLVVVSSAQAGPMLAPYASSGQVDILVNGLYDASRYEYVNNTRPGIARSYWDAFGVGLFMAIVAIVLGSVWNIFMGIRERRAQAEQG
jgi:hypothetical protein